MWFTCGKRESTNRGVRPLDYQQRAEDPEEGIYWNSGEGQRYWAGDAHEVGLRGGEKSQRFSGKPQEKENKTKKVAKEVTVEDVGKLESPVEAKQTTRDGRGRSLSTQLICTGGEGYRGTVRGCKNNKEKDQALPTTSWVITHKSERGG